MLPFPSHPNLAMLQKVARRLTPFLQEIAFVGGATVALYMTRRGLQPIRPTDDVDVIVEVASRVRYHAFAEKLRQLGFHEDVDARILCRWNVEGITVDVMPTDTSILGFSNRWYGEALSTATKVELEPGLLIRLITAPYFLATKIEAFNGRGRGDFLISHDINDMMMLILGREEVIDEITNSNPELSSFLAGQFQEWLIDRDFRDAIYGHLHPDEISQSHQALILSRFAPLPRSLNVIIPAAPMSPR